MFFSSPNFALLNHPKILKPLPPAEAQGRREKKNIFKGFSLLLLRGLGQDDEFRLSFKF
jgi:hypothetical protein